MSFNFSTRGKTFSQRGRGRGRGAQGASTASTSVFQASSSNSSSDFTTLPEQQTQPQSLFLPPDAITDLGTKVLAIIFDDKFQEPAKSLLAQMEIDMNQKVSLFYCAPDFFLPSKDLGHLKIGIQSQGYGPLNKTVRFSRKIYKAHKPTSPSSSLGELTHLVKTFNFKEIEQQISNIFRETTDQTDFSQRLATAIRIGIHDRLRRIEENLFNFIRSYQTNQSSFTSGILGQTQITETTYYIHIDDLSPDRTHFIQ